MYKAIVILLYMYIKTSVSLSSPVVKIFESIVKDNIMNNDSLLPPNQHGFTPQSLIQVINYWTRHFS